MAGKYTNHETREHQLSVTQKLKQKQLRNLLPKIRAWKQKFRNLTEQSNEEIHTEMTHFHQKMKIDSKNPSQLERDFLDFYW